MDNIHTYLHSQLSPLYKTYNEVIKPLVADIESRYEKFPRPIFNEIRAFNDHVARCYTEPLDKRIISEQIPKATGHIERILLDCYKFLNVKLHENIVGNFERKTKYIDITSIDSGNFYPKYKVIYNDIVLKKREAKTKERTNKEDAILLYEQVYIQYDNLDDLLEKYRLKINWAIAKFTTKKILSFLGWFGAAIISGIISSSFLPWDKFLQWIVSIF
ncbi:MAG: hypothetical protein LBN27_05600 [Prevotellaceae bacterium]|jgi:hypothetical protein|nr:hypothetical protein [Prevotellaceae bacterium]